LGRIPKTKSIPSESLAINLGYTVHRVAGYNSLCAPSTSNVWLSKNSPLNHCYICSIGFDGVQRLLYPVTLSAELCLVFREVLRESVFG